MKVDIWNEDIKKNCKKGIVIAIFERYKTNWGEKKDPVSCTSHADRNIIRNGLMTNDMS